MTTERPSSHRVDHVTHLADKSQRELLGGNPFSELGFTVLMNRVNLQLRTELDIPHNRNLKPLVFQDVEKFAGSALKFIRHSVEYAATTSSRPNLGLREREENFLDLDELDLVIRVHRLSGDKSQNVAPGEVHGASDIDTSTTVEVQNRFASTMVNWLLAR